VDRGLRGPGPPGRLSALRVFHSKSFLYGAFVWVRRVLNRQKTAVPGPGRYSTARGRRSTRSCRRALTTRSGGLTRGSRRRISSRCRRPPHPPYTPYRNRICIAPYYPMEPYSSPTYTHTTSYNLPASSHATPHNPAQPLSFVGRRRTSGSRSTSARPRAPCRATRPPSARSSTRWTVLLTTGAVIHG
jgi:hypothetical protein